MLWPVDHTCPSKVLCVSTNMGKGTEPMSTGCSAVQLTPTVLQGGVTALMDPGKVRTCLQSHSSGSLSLNRAVCCKAGPFLQQCRCQNVPRGLTKGRGWPVRPHQWKLAQPDLHMGLSGGGPVIWIGFSLSHHPSWSRPPPHPRNLDADPSLLAPPQVHSCSLKSGLHSAGDL